jgi:hypothetical protein
VLQAAKSEGRGYDDTDNQRKKKKIAALHYKRRKLDKDVKRYIKENSRLNSKELDEIGTRNGFYFG